jgi:hypothetical protein
MSSGIFFFFFWKKKKKKKKKKGEAYMIGNVVEIVFVHGGDRHLIGQCPPSSLSSCSALLRQTSNTGVYIDS